MDRSAFVRMTILGSFLAALAVIGGCKYAGWDVKDPPPPPPGGGDAPLTINTEAERAAVTEVERARVEYRYRLEVMEAYYTRVGNADKRAWTQDEIKNLDDCQKFRWSGVAPIAKPSGEDIQNVDSLTLVELLVASRKHYKACVEELAQFYGRQGAGLKEQLVRNMQARFQLERQYTYLDSAEYPPMNLHGSRVITEANEMYNKAHKLYEDGKGWGHTFFSTRYDKEREALAVFKELIEKYPDSDKIAMSAYWIGEIYKEYFNEDVRAVNWYERAWTWDAAVPKPARFEAAVVYDYRLKNRAQALRCYRLAVQYEQFNSTNVGFSQGRIRELERGN